MEKKLYMAPRTKFVNPVGEPLMDFNVGGSAGEDFEFAKENDFENGDDWEDNGHSVWED